MRLLLVDGFDAPTRRRLAAAGANPGHELYRRVLQDLAPDAAIDVVHPADGDAALPAGRALADYDGACWTGSSLSVLDAAREPAVARQLDLIAAIFAARVPAFGSCWAVQVAGTVAGGQVARCARGREFAIARKIELTEAGRGHPLFDGKPGVFDSLCSHEDEIVRPPSQAEVLARNGHSPVQAIAIRHEGGRFWGVQYHPEFDLGEIAGIIRFRRDSLVELGLYADSAAADAHHRDLTALQAAPARRDLAWRLGIDADILDPERRLREVRNWLASLSPRAT